MSVNYNDGKWHGHNGGGCPVHPETVVEYVMDNSSPPQQEEAEYANWICNMPHLANIVAFRVIKEHREPREFWIFMGHIFLCHDEALSYAHEKQGEIIHVREVLE